MSTFLQNAAAVSRVLGARLRFVAVFVVAALVVGNWEAVVNRVDAWTRPAHAPDSLAAEAASDVEYYCPMDGAVQDHPGPCPNCGMPLVKRMKMGRMALPADVLARVQLTPQKLSLGNIGTTRVGYERLTREVKAVGTIDYDETKVADLSARVAGRADELFVNFVGQQVKKGDPLYSIYSPDAFTALREYLQAHKRMAAMPKDAPEEMMADAMSLQSAAAQKLSLWGITPEQLAGIAAGFDKTGDVPTHLTVLSPASGVVTRKDVRRGGYVQAGDTPFTVADLSDVWFEAKVYEADVRYVRVGQGAEVSVEAFPGRPLAGRVTFVASQLDPETRTLEARIEVPNADLSLKPGMFATATLRVEEDPSTTRPADAGPAAYAAALELYLTAHDRLADGKTEGVRSLLLETTERLMTMTPAPPGLDAVEEQIRSAGESDLEPLRSALGSLSRVMISTGQSVGLPPGAAPVVQFSCPMGKPDWLQRPGAVANPYGMPTCGTRDADLPQTPGAGTTLAVPRSAVIDTGKSTVVYVRSADGVFDLHAVRLGPAAGEWYPVLSGLRAGDEVVTRGTFLVDAENRLNPSDGN